jgi:hypothetical protein
MQSELGRLTAQINRDVTRRAFGDVGPAFVEAHRAMAAAVAEAGTAAFEALPFPGWIGISLDAPCTVELRDGEVFA